MADNLTVTQGVGTIVATDQCGTAHYQKVKLADGAADATTMIAADIGVKANALRVAPANNITAGTYIGKVSIDHTTPATTDAVVAGGDVAHGTADAGNPVKVGGKAINMDGTVPGTAVAEDDRTNLRTDLYGRLLVEGEHPNFWRATAAYAAAQTKTEVKAAPGSGLSLYITDIVISNGATAGTIKLIEDTASAATDVLSTLFLAINGPCVMQFATPLKLTANKNLGITSVTVTTHSITVSGYIAP